MDFLFVDVVVSKERQKSRDPNVATFFGQFCSTPLSQAISLAVKEMEPEIQKLLQQHPSASLVYMGHGMGTAGGASAAQHWAEKSKAKAVVLVAGFLERVWRPDIAKCMKSWEIQPTLRCPKGLCPGGYLEDGVHNCSATSLPSPSYPLPSLSIGGELDGLVRISRIAEAWYTQQDLPQHQADLQRED